MTTREQRLEVCLRRKNRLVAAAAGLAFIAGFAFHAIISVPPVWLSELPDVEQVTVEQVAK